ncbi:hypothetical protein [Alicyclobacillus fastidiosus]|uniref:Uncharacterized protein n=1 Tax=Alicyclobacillus fastidiosus TaxID=392011 RepID=A0ABV5AM03_9BACL|nr:hypothetical protein [Alicyclobacillus fastidiosus]WEH08039.1 hypothetical protein PYS47_14925 [Alicyclobacillus fastidiosus]WEH08047.1 hypothetical protein PYS47_14985 [Alicyclobacillus fastidiosus]WEH08048.1 hypothetical protein PYS47_15125 [Alicyclobacillus fastidiosus]WEH08872.1 hypothetical protein PYS47_19635 [Alicyclobacillus fastidiosus]WEH09372.1 hypothetical protein PYS47_22325 [Alicyclobacillus fastidiosus]
MTSRAYFVYVSESEDDQRRNPKQIGRRVVPWQLNMEQPLKK